MKKAVFAAGCVLIVLGFALATAVHRSRRAGELGAMAQGGSSALERPHSPSLGSADAKVVIVKFTDPACETCAAFSPFVKKFMDAYPDKIRLVIRYAPFHEGADGAVRILEAARRQGRFWETLDVLYASQGGWTRHHHVDVASIWQFLPHAGVDAARVKAEMGDPAIGEVLRQDLADAEALGVSKTPGFFVNGRPLEPFGAQPLADLISAELRANYRD